MTMTDTTPASSPGTRNWDDFAEDYLFLRETGTHFEVIARRLGVKPKTLETYCRRLDLPMKDDRE